MNKYGNNTNIQINYNPLDTIRSIKNLVCYLRLLINLTFTIVITFLKIREKLSE